MSDEQSESEQPARAASGDATGNGAGKAAASSERTPRRRRVLVLLFGLASVLLALDVVTKSLAVAHLEDEPPVKLLGGALYLVLFRNPGAAFSLATGATWLLALLAVVVVGAIIWFAPKLRSTGWAVGIGLVLGGACGNLVDRIFREPAPLRGHVIDFLSVFAPDGSVWPVFNLADSGIVCGGVLVVVLSLLGYDYDGTVHRRKAKRDETADPDRDGGEAQRPNQAAPEHRPDEHRPDEHRPDEDRPDEDRT